MHIAILAGAVALVVILLYHLDHSHPAGGRGWRARINAAFAGFGSELGELNCPARITAVDELRAQRSQALKAARTIAEKAHTAGRDFTPAERTQVAVLISESKSIGERADKAAEDQAAIDYISDFDHRLAAGSMGRGMSTAPGSWGMAFARASGFKDALAPSGSLTVPVLSADIAPLQDRPATLLSAISFQGLEPSGSFQYVRESVQDLRATSVIPGRVKPTSDIELEAIIDRARTVAHLSGGIDRNTLMDSGSVQGFLDGVMRLGVERALEAMVLTGDETDINVDDFAGLTNASGTIHQTFVTSVLVSIRKALTSAQERRLAGPWLIAMAPSTWEALELLTSTEHYVLGDPGNPGRTLPIDTGRQALFGQRVALTPALDGTVAIVGDFSPTSIRIREREACVLTWSEATQLPIADDSGGAMASGFQLNKLQFRAEGRYGLELRRPHAFTIVDLA